MNNAIYSAEAARLWDLWVLFHVVLFVKWNTIDCVSSKTLRLIVLVDHCQTVFSGWMLKSLKIAIYLLMKYLSKLNKSSKITLDWSKFNFVLVSSCSNNLIKSWTSQIDWFITVLQSTILLPQNAKWLYTHINLSMIIMKLVMFVQIVENPVLMPHAHKHPPSTLKFKQLMQLPRWLLCHTEEGNSV